MSYISDTLFISIRFMNRIIISPMIPMYISGRVRSRNNDLTFVDILDMY